MDHRLFRAACNGDIEELYMLLQENPFLLADDSLISLHENPITTAIKARQLLFLREIKKLRPALIAQPNQDGFLPLHIACSYGYVEIVKELLSPPSSETVCRAISGKDGKTPLHYATINGRVDIIDELLTACSDSVKDVTYFGETALHLTTKHFKFEALKRLLIWLEHTGMTEIVNYGDKEGNTILHYAVSRKQVETVEYLLQWNTSTGNSTISLVNAVNKKGFTAMDILDILTEFSSDSELRKILQIAGAASSEIHHVAPNEVPNNPSSGEIQNNNETTAGCSKCKNRPDGKPEKWMEYFQFQYKRDSPGEARDALLVVTALFVSVTFQAGINPPEHIFKNAINQDSLVVTLTIFLCANTLALSAATTVIEMLTKEMPFQRELFIALFFMSSAYGVSLGSTKPTGRIPTILIFASMAFPWCVRFLPMLYGSIKAKVSRR